MLLRQMGSAAQLPRCGRAKLRMRGSRFLASSAALRAPLTWATARFGGATIDIDDEVQPEFEERLIETLQELKAAGRRGVWLHVPIEHSGAAALASRHGFKFHSAEGDRAVLLRWLPDSRCPVPAFATHIVGVGGLVFNDDQRVLCVREARTPSGQPGSTHWKLPGGLMDLGEEIGDAAAREVLEETGVRAEFEALLAMRVQHGAAFGRDDFYFVAAMRAGAQEISLSGQGEIAECAWLSLEEYVASTDARAKELGVGDNMNSWLMRNIATEIAAGSPPKEWGWTQTALAAGGAKSANQITGWGSRDFFHVYAPPRFLPPRGVPAE